MSPELIAIAPTIGLAVLGWLARGYESRIKKLEVEAQRARDAEHVLDVRLTATEERMHSVKNGMQGIREELSEIRDNMVRRADLDALAQRIDDLLRRFTPVPIRRK